MVNALNGLVAVSCNLDAATAMKSHRVGHTNVTALMEVARVMPVLVPAMAASDIELVLDRVDGVLLTGGRANVEPHHYDGDPDIDCGPHDPGRDAIALAMARSAVKRGIPLFGICRGIQEMNVAFGGSLFPWLHEVPGREDHRREKHLPLADGLRPRHRIILTPGGQLQALAGGLDSVIVNSLHGQAIDRLGEGLVVEALAEDGTVEAIRVAEARTFAMGVQWHAEWRTLEHPIYTSLFEAFGDAVRAHAASRDRMGQVA